MPQAPPTDLDTIARVCHEANRAWCEAHGDHSQPVWGDAPDWQRQSALKGVQAALYGNTARQSHEGWLAEKLATGWTYGPVKDPVLRTHPCILPYDQLAPEQQRKDHLFVAIVGALR